MGDGEMVTEGITAECIETFAEEVGTCVEDIICCYGKVVKCGGNLEVALVLKALAL